jgi:L-seryl-tRNA(Ser) seleniumtransferase
VAQTDPRRAVPRTDAVLADPRIAAAAERIGRSRVKALVAETLAEVRAGRVAPDAAVDCVVAALPPHATSLRRVINATGVVLHTNLGRAQLSQAAVDALCVAAAAVDVEYDLATGRRARRGRHTLAALRRAVPEAGDVLVVNNGAAALVLATTAFAAGHEVVVSRGELVEIGDGFRLPDLIESAGARLREVGTTNRAALADYAAAVGPATGCVLKVHPSNFRIEGFTSAVPVRELVTLGVPVVADIGSGLLRPDPLLPDEPDVAGTLAAGATVVTCSGDKLLGGPQAGLVFGDADAVERLRRHPLARALRVDKLTLAALEGTVDGPVTPTYAALHADARHLRERCSRLAATLPDVSDARVVPSVGAVGGGGAPGVELPGWALSLPSTLADRLRAGDPPVIARIEDGRCLLDLRSVAPADDDIVRAAVSRAVEGV